MDLTIDQAISQYFQAKMDTTYSKVAIAMIGKQLDAQQAQGDAVVQMIQQAAAVQQQLASGHLDIKV